MCEDTKKIFNSLKESNLYKIFKKVEGHFNEGEIYLVGGALRDALVGKRVNDLDFSTTLRPEEVLKRLSGQKLRTLGIEFGTVTWRVDGVDVEITTFRCDETYENHRHPDSLKFGTSRLEDLKRRDFTINAMMFSSASGLYDPFKGSRDIKNKIIKAVGLSEKRFKEDALRILRMYRFHLNYSFEIEEKTLSAAKKNISLIKKISKQRVVLEVKKIFSKEVDVLLLVKTIKNLFGVDIKVIRGHSIKRLNLYEQVYCLKKINGDFKEYVYEKAYKRIYDLYTGLENVDSLKEYQMLILNFYNKNKLTLLEGERLWFCAKEFGKEFSDAIGSFKPVSLSHELLSKLKENYSGKELGEKLLEEELKQYFNK